MARLSVVSFILIFSVFCGCSAQIPSFDDWAKGLIGRKLGELKEVHHRPGSYVSRTGWKEKMYTLDNGGMVYVFPINKDCIVHAEMNDDEIVINYWTEGVCR